MTTAADVRQVPNALTGEESTPNQAASGFTAVNGRSPSELTHHSRQVQQDGPTREQDLEGGPAPANGASGAAQTSADIDLSSRAPSASPGPNREDLRKSPGKRKRSSSADVSPSSRSLSPSKRYRSPPLNQTDRETQSTSGNASAGNLSNGTPSSSNANGHHANGVAASEQDARYGDPSGQQWTPRDGEMQDAQFAEALTRGTQQLHDTSQQVDEVETSPDPKYSSQTPQPANNTQHTMSAIQPVTAGQLSPSFQKQRKRNFSNRTKTGCLTCRSRKKKCDEAKPTCKNCERGGFTCQGYSQSNLPYKTSNIGAPVAPLQAKSGGPFFEPYPFTNHGRPAPPPPPPSTGFFSEHPQLAPTTDSERTVSNTQDSHIRAQYNRPSWSDNQQGGPFPQENLQAGPPLPDPRGERTLPPPPNTQPGGPQRSGSNSSHYTQLAQSALQHPGANSRNLGPQPQPFWSEKDKMRCGYSFIRNDPQLVEDRKQCATACHKFNLNASDPQNLNDAERYARFRQIIQPKSLTPTSRSPSGAGANGEGCVGERVSVEAPFNCEYGYNIFIGDDTEIGPGCRIMDSCSVSIGARCYIGPNVTFYTTEGDQQPAQLGPGGRKQRRLTRGNTIVVEDDVYIAGNVVVQPGTRIGASATIAAGTMLDRNIKSTYSVYPDTKHGGADIVTGLWRPQPHGATLS